MPLLLSRLELAAAALWRDYPPRIHNPKKGLLFELSGSRERIPDGILVVTRWTPSAADEAGRVGPVVEVASVDGPFIYDDDDAWHLNFADTELFAFYGGPAFAQDEIQVAEHPLLASLRVALSSGVRGDDGTVLPPLTEEGGRPTPILVQGVERWCAIDTDPESAMPYGIYGRRLAHASDEALKEAVTRLNNAPKSNIVAMVAPQGTGRYSTSEIRHILLTAVTGFGAVQVETRRPVRVHTGHWGTGAFGGDRILMAAAQMVAARMVGLGVLVFHSLDDDGLDAVKKARIMVDRIAEGTSFDEVVEGLHSRGFAWGSSDGN